MTKTTKARKKADSPVHAAGTVDPGAPKVVRCRMDELVLLPELQIRVARDEETVREYAAVMAHNPDSFPPLDVFQIDGKRYLVNGWTRHNAALTAKLDDIRCTLRHCTSMEGAWVFAWGANKTNGQRLTTKDKQHAIAVALHRHPDWSSSRIADLIGCTHPTVESCRKNLPTDQVDAVRITSDGKRRKVKAKHKKVADKVGKIVKASTRPKMHLVDHSADPVDDDDGIERDEDQRLLLASANTIAGLLANASADQYARMSADLAAFRDVWSDIQADRDARDRVAS